jgi:hypothetical protein
MPITNGNKPQRAESFLRLHEALPAPGDKILAPFPATNDSFLKSFRALYLRTPAAYKNRPADLASELVKTRLLAGILQELRALVSAIKPKPKL